MAEQLVLERVRNEIGKFSLMFSMMAFSDVHLGTSHCRAKKLTGMLGNTQADRTFIVGDLIDGEALSAREIWKFGHGEHSWHKQVLAQILYKAEQGRQITYIPGNHDVDIRQQTRVTDARDKLHHNLCGKKLLGIHIVEEALYPLPNGKYVKLIHGDQFDKALHQCKGFGNAALEIISHIDTWINKQPGCDQVSLFAAAKKLAVVRYILNRIWSIRKNITDHLDDSPELDMIITGHSHISEISCTPGGKTIVNDGCCTEQVEAFVMDRYGTKALIEWHKKHLKITEMGGEVRKVSWQELGLSHFEEPPQVLGGSCAENADRLIRLIYRQWPPQTRKAQMAIERSMRNAGGLTSAMPTAGYIDLPNPRHLKLKKETRETFKGLQFA